MRALSAVALLLALAGAAPAHCLAFSTLDVDMTDPVYRDIDRLAAAGLVEVIIFGQRPYSRLEVARIIVQAEEGLACRQGSLGQPLEARLERIVARLARRFAPEVRFLGEGAQPPPLGVAPIEGGRLTYAYTNSPPAHFVANNGNGGIDNARIQPFAYYSQGQPLAAGSQAVAEWASSLRASRFFSFLVEPRFYVPLGADAGSRAEVLQLYGRLVAGPLQVTAGRQSLVWGQGSLAGLLVSRNAFPLDLVMLESGEPTLLPSFLSALGPVKAAFFYSDLGDSYQPHPGAYLLGLKVSLEPFPNLEFGVSNLVLSGGRGAPEAGLGQRVKDLFTLDTDKSVSNRLGGFEGRLRLPALRGASLYLELMFDDTNRSLGVLLVDEAAYLVGLYAPLADAAGRLSLRAEYHHLGIRFYRHGQFPVVRRGDILGDPLGPNSQGAYLSALYELSETLELEAQVAAEFRGSDLFAVNDWEEFTQEIIAEGPQERRYRLLAGACWEPLAGLRLGGEFGYERVANFNFEDGNNRDNYLARVSVGYLFGCPPP